MTGPDINPSCSSCGCDIVHMKVVSRKKADEDSGDDDDNSTFMSPDQRTGFFCFYTNRGLCSVCGKSKTGLQETQPFTFKQHLTSVGGLEELYQSYYTPIFTCQDVLKSRAVDQATVVAELLQRRAVQIFVERFQCCEVVRTMVRQRLYF